MAIAFRHLVRKPDGDTEIEGSGVRVYTVLGLRQAGDTPEEIADAYRLPLGAVYEALAYAADNPEEMEAIRQAEADIERDWLSRLPEELRRGADLSR
jgi:uncharacterized protein (DUF433 family)